MYGPLFWACPDLRTYSNQPIIGWSVTQLKAKPGGTAEHLFLTAPLESAGSRTECVWFRNQNGGRRFLIYGLSPQITAINALGLPGRAFAKKESERKNYIAHIELYSLVWISLSVYEVTDEGSSPEIAQYNPYYLSF